MPHEDIGCWWTLYDYGLDVVKTWPRDYVHPYPGDQSFIYLPDIAHTASSSLMLCPLICCRLASAACHPDKKVMFGASTERARVKVCACLHDSTSLKSTEAKRREVEEAARKVKKAAKRAAKQAADAAEEAAAADAGKAAPAEPPAAAASGAAAAKPAAVPQTPICFLFPGQGSQALGMLNVRYTLPTLTACSEGSEQIRDCFPVAEDASQCDIVQQLLSNIMTFHATAQSP